MSTQDVQYVLLFLVLVVISDQFQNFTELHALTLAARFYALLYLLIHVCVMGTAWKLNILLEMN